MKVTKTGSASGPDSARKSKKSGGGDGAFAEALKGTAGADSVDPAPATGGVNAVEALFAIQQTADATDHRSRGLMMDYGNDLLDRLDHIRMAILGGTISKDGLMDLARRLRERKIHADDAHLNTLIDEIELRVEVEIAKLTR